MVRLEYARLVRDANHLEALTYPTRDLIVSNAFLHNCICPHAEAERIHHDPHYHADRGPHTLGKIIDLTAHTFGEEAIVHKHTHHVGVGRLAP